MDLKLKVIGYDILATKPSDIEGVMNGFMKQVQVKDVHVTTFASRVLMHIFYYGDEPVYEETPKEEPK